MNNPPLPGSQAALEELVAAAVAAAVAATKKEFQRESEKFQRERDALKFKIEEMAAQAEVSAAFRREHAEMQQTLRGELIDTEPFFFHHALKFASTSRNLHH